MHVYLLRSQSNIKDLNSKEESIFVGKINNYFKYKIKYTQNNFKKGELYLEGPSISRGYINNSAATKNLFITLENLKVIKLEI